MEDRVFDTSICTLCAALADVFGVERPEHAEPPRTELVDFARRELGGTADRIFLYNPDAVGAWVSEKYAALLPEVFAHTGLALDYHTVMPSVTPVCFSSIYTGAEPAVHGIRKYEKPVQRTDTLFDAAIRAGKRCAIVAKTKCSMAMIFQERRMDYYIYDTLEEINACAAELILRDCYDLLVVYNGNYDHAMHHNGPESLVALGELRANGLAFGQFYELIRRNWKMHDTFLGFCMDHGCHEIDAQSGSHGLDMPEDLNIRHFYACLPKAQ